jgi:hypothetical protein
VLNSISPCDNASWFIFFLHGKADSSCSEKSFSTPRYPRSITLTTYLGAHGLFFLYTEYIIMPSSFLIAYLANHKNMIFNHNLILYCRMSFPPVSRIVYPTFSFIYRSRHLVLCTIYKSKNAWKILFYYFFCRFQPFGYLICFLWNQYTLPYHIQYSIFNIQSFAYLYAYVAHINQRENKKV